MRYIIIFVGLLIFSCDSSRVYEDYVDMDNAYWHMDSIPTFTFKIEDTSKGYNLLATFRNASTYPFYNIYFQYSLTDSLDSVVIEKQREADLFDPKTGEPLGSGLGDLFDHKVLLEENFTFENPGTYNLKFQQFMRLDTLPFILSVGGRVELTEVE